ncbi:calcium/sodium antiporter [Myxococcus sp. RHSTA-1-4]|uniref:calcium/sodium antiporter n=1 Tax=Myxococcus sp. RHSTA-1-4 TaxID=2874601 RepID=UPI001CBCAE8D|nr:calcium/sodium antiporter [Myxococcus sp. RHSTA-1-4]MBZ4417936.1 calcium/sodium antiporter [Myxococcus sp. RHSTA-1-4]
MELFLSLSMLVGGITLLVAGGDWLVSGAVALAERRGVPALTIGLTIVAFGTSAPELALNVVVALTGDTALSFGNMVGSSLANAGLILGLSAVLRPVKVQSSLLRRELPMLLGAVLLLVTLMLLPGTFGPPGSPPGLSRLDGALLLAGFAAYLGVLLRAARRPAEVGWELTGELKEAVRAEPLLSTRRSVGLLLGGLVLLAAGGKLTETGAVRVATLAGLSAQVIGLTVVSLATTLPELVTSLAALRRGQSDIALGNVLGSNLFNLLFILGVVAMMATVPLPVGGLSALLALGALTLLLFPVSVTFDWTITRSEGALLVLVYLSIIGYQLWRGLTLPAM